MKKLNIATLGMPADYPSSLIPIIIRDLGYETVWTSQLDADILVYGPFFQKTKPYRWLPKPLRPLTNLFHPTWMKRWNPPITLFQTGENVRHDTVNTDYAISFDFTKDEKHFRFPYWMEMVDWSHEGIIGNANPRFGKLLSLHDMTKPLGSEFLKRNMKAAFITSHLNEPRKTLWNAITKIIEVEGFGPYFNHEIKNHHESRFNKIEVLSHFTFNLCPENGLYPGYYTEKIPEAFLSGCLPLTWVDSNVGVDFNPLAMINLQTMMGNNFEGLKKILTDKEKLKIFAEQPLLIKKPSIEPLKQFLRKILSDTLS